MNDRISSFNPIIDEQSKILILGSVPGVKSLEQQEYYAHPQNKFWTIIFELLDAEFTLNYDLKLNILKQNKIALWDVIDSCERKGSLDSEIKNEEINDIKSLLEMHPNIKAIFCNGGKSYKELVKILGKNYLIPIFLLPSTSPLHTISYEKKLNSWQIISKHL
ncbi:DNA-deoxyinosine glycosylase [Chryseobacterium sp.]|uniref:DNA-deoxyinosine glycosylase n=1 Tax=Chryseobacterium sp. TaxID=1871047 RepID=UPI00389118E7